jgi:RNA polymerase sigma-70 factor (ECF subfamily)
MGGLIDQEILAGVVESASTGDEVAFARIVAAHHADMTRVSFVVCGDLDMAHEAVQAAWPIAWRKLRSLQDPSRLRPWLIAVAANEARQLIRRRTRRSIFEIHVEDGEDAQRGYRTGGDPAEHAAEVDLAAALQRLAPEERVVVAMRYLIGLNSSEIGQAIGMSPPGVRARLARSLDRLREDLGDG